MEVECWEAALSLPQPFPISMSDTVSITLISQYQDWLAWLFRLDKSSASLVVRADKNLADETDRSINQSVPALDSTR